MSKATRTLVTRFSGEVDPSLDRATKQTLGIATGLGTMFGNLAAKGIGLAVEKAKDFASAMVGAASTAEQSIGGVEAVFKEHADGMLAQAEKADRALGLTANAYRDLATGMGSLLKNQGLQDFAGDTQRLVGLGADLAAQYGGSTKNAVEAITSLMRGEANPIERYGVSLNMTAVNAELAARGQDKLTGAALETAKAQARLDLLFRQTADAQGAFARESETFEGKQQRAAAMWENLQAKMGGAFLPTLTNIMGFVQDKAIPGLEKFGDGIVGVLDILTKGELSDGLMSALGMGDGWDDDSAGAGAIAVLFSLRDAAMETWDRLQQFGADVSSLFGSDFDVAGLERALGDTLLWLANEGIPRATDAIGGFLDGLQGMLEWGKENEGWLTPLAGGLATVVGGLMLMSLWQGIVTGGGLVKWLATVARSTALYTGAQWLLNVAMSANPIGLVILALTALGVGLAIAWNKSETFRKIVTGAWEKIKGAASGVTDWFTKTALPGLAGFWEGAQRGFDGLVGFLGGWATRIKNAVMAPINWIGQHVLNPLLSGIEKVAGIFGLKWNLPRFGVAAPSTSTGGPNRASMFWAGGYTGHGGKYEPVGVVHAGEVVWSQDDVAAHGGPMAVERMRKARGIPGFAGGGLVPNAKGWGGMNAAFLASVQAWARATGRRWYVTGNGGFRAFSDQKRAWDLYQAGRGPLAANPYKGGPHMRGEALDLSPRPGENAAARALLGQFGLGLTVRGEPWHVGWLRRGAGGQVPGGGGGGFDPLGFIKSMIKLPTLDGGGLFGDLLRSIPGRLMAGAAEEIKHALGFDQGGWLQPGATLAVNRTGRPEPVFTSGQWDVLRTRMESADATVEQLDDLIEAVWALVRATMTRDDFDQLLRTLRRPAPQMVEAL